MTPRLTTTAFRHWIMRREYRPAGVATRMAATVEAVLLALPEVGMLDDRTAVRQALQAYPSQEKSKTCYPSAGLSWAVFRRWCREEYGLDVPQ